MPFVVTGETAKKMLEEIERKPTEKELAVLVRAVKNRVPRRKGVEKMKKINTYDMVLAICFNNTGIIVDHGGVVHADFWLDGSCFCYENGFVRLPKEKGVYQCKVEHWTSADVELGGWEFRVVESKKIS